MSNRGTRASLYGPRRAAVIANCRATQPLCWLCGFPWIPDAPRHHPLAHAVDEVIPRSRGGSGWDIDNCRSAHACCNGARNNRIVTPALVQRCRDLYALHTTGTMPRRPDLASSRRW